MFQKGDIVKANLNPTKGHEQGEYRPLLVMNKRDSFVLSDTNSRFKCKRSSTYRKSTRRYCGTLQ